MPTLNKYDLFWVKPKKAVLDTLEQTTSQMTALATQLKPEMTTPVSTIQNIARNGTK